MLALPGECLSETGCILMDSRGSLVELWSFKKIDRDRLTGSIKFKT